MAPRPVVITQLCEAVLCVVQASHLSHVLQAAVMTAAGPGTARGPGVLVRPSQDAADADRQAVPD